MMLHHIIQAHGGTLPDDVLVTFANTGKERPETLDFVRDCGEHWDVDIHWLERDPKTKFREVYYEKAAREGEPFADLIKSKKYLPNPVARFCTGELKIKVISLFALAQGFDDGWSNVVGLRHDEPSRVAKMKARNEVDKWDNDMPMDTAKLTKRDVAAFWYGQNFDLGLPNINGTTPMGNCDLCFLKGAATLQGIMRANPGASDWWQKQEAEIGLFRSDRPSYAAMQKAVDDQDEFDFGDADSLGDCFCTD